MFAPSAFSTCHYLAQTGCNCYVQCARSASTAYGARYLAVDESSELSEAVVLSWVLFACSIAEIEVAKSSIRRWIEMQAVLLFKRQKVWHNKVAVFHCNL